MTSIESIQDDTMELGNVTKEDSTIGMTKDTTPASASATSFGLPVAVASATDPHHGQGQEQYDPEAGRGIGIAMLVLTCISLVCSVIAMLIGFTGFIALLCDIATMVLASCVVCNCCCARDYRLSPNRRKFAIVILCFTCLQFALILTAVLIYMLSTDYYGAVGGLIAVVAIDLAFRVINLVFASLFTCGQNCCNGDNNADGQSNCCK